VTSQYLPFFLTVMRRGRRISFTRSSASATDSGGAVMAVAVRHQASALRAG